MKCTHNPLRVGLTYDLRSEYLARGLTDEQVAEFDSDATIDILAATIADLGYQVDRIGSLHNLCSRLVAGDRWDLVFNVAEGYGSRCREAYVPALLEAWGIPYTFSDPLVCALTLDKSLAKRQVAFAGLHTPRFALFANENEIRHTHLRFPLFAKPNGEGTGKGIDSRSRIGSADQLTDVCSALISRGLGPVLVEEYLPGREFTVGILGTGSAARVIGTMEIEILPHSGQLEYGFEAKETCETGVCYSTPPCDTLRSRVEDLAHACYRVLECRDAGRVDIRLDASGEPAFLEINPLAGLHPQHSDLPMIGTRAGMSYASLIAAIIDSALERTARPSNVQTGRAAACLPLPGSSIPALGIPSL